jgi:hypothetical protein
MPPDPRDELLVEAIVGSVRTMMIAVHSNDTPALVGGLGLLVNAMIEHRDAMTERASDEPLRRALERL